MPCRFASAVRANLHQYGFDGVRSCATLNGATAQGTPSILVGLDRCGVLNVGDILCMLHNAFIAHYHYRRRAPTRLLALRSRSIVNANIWKSVRVQTGQQ